MYNCYNLLSLPLLENTDSGSFSLTLELTVASNLVFSSSDESEKQVHR